MTKHKKNKHDIDQLDGNTSICKEENETSSFNCTFCGEALDTEVKQNWHTVSCLKNERSQDILCHCEIMHQQALAGGFPPWMY